MVAGSNRDQCCEREAGESDVSRLVAHCHSTWFSLIPVAYPLERLLMGMRKHFRSCSVNPVTYRLDEIRKI